MFSTSTSKDVPWYQKEPDRFSPACRELLENYSHIPPEEVSSHVFQIRERAWDSKPYPCLGLFRFLDLSISLEPSYPRILSFLKEPQSQHTFLDLGCCFAQNIRKLVYDGVPSENLYASDLEQSFLDLSYDLFKDSDTMKAHLFVANAIGEDAALDKMQGKVDFIYAGAFFHLFGWDDQVKICKRIIKTLKPQKGSLVFGRQTGNVKGLETPATPVVGKDPPMIYRHSLDSFTELWDLAGRETGTKWKTSGKLDQAPGRNAVHWSEPGLRRLTFEVERVE